MRKTTAVLLTKTQTASQHNSNNTDNLKNLITQLQTCAKDKNIKHGKQIHAKLLRTSLITSPLSLTSLINMYSKSNHLSHAITLFNTTCTYTNVYVYNAMISGYVSAGLAKDGIECYRQMRVDGSVVPDRFTFPSLIKGFCDVGVVDEVRKVIGVVIKLGLELDLFVGSALVKGCLQFGLVEDAHKVFDGLSEMERDVVLWNALVNGYAGIGRFEEALGVFRRMVEEGVGLSMYTVTGVLSVFSVTGGFGNGRAVHGVVVKLGFDSRVSVCNALVDMYGKCKCVGSAVEVFETMVERDLFSWNSVIAVFEQCGDHDGALRMFDRMLAAKVKPDLITVTTVLPACSHLSALMHGREIHGFLIVNGLTKDGNCQDVKDVLMNNAVMDMYAKCGSMRDAHMVFDRMSYKDVASWNILIMGYGMHGSGKQALDLFSQMCEAKLVPDEVTFVGVLSACSHAGFVEQGREYLKHMQEKYGVVPTIEHYTCVIDMLGRAGQLEEAYEAVLSMPVEDNPVVWRALLAACRNHNNTELAEVAAQRVIELDPEHCGNYVLMSNIYVEAGRYQEVSDVRHTMKQHNVKKSPGCSWTELQDGVHAFITADMTHPAAQMIYDVLNSLTARLRDHGYVPNI